MNGSNVATGCIRERLVSGWEYVRGDLGGIWEAVRYVKKGNPESVPLWSPVSLPHCFNATDAVDPDVNYYQGPGWYRTTLAIQQPYPDGRVVLHFEGAGQKTRVYVYTTEVAEHIGGYDEFTVDITEAVREFMATKVCREQFHGRVPVIIRCDNTRDLETIPSDLSDFNLYGGLYRYVNLLYLPPLYVERVTVRASVSGEGNKGVCEVSAAFVNHARGETAQVEVCVLDMAGVMIAEKSAMVQVGAGRQDLFKVELDHPVLWSPEQPYLYTCRVTVRSTADEHCVSERFGFRFFEFVKHGPFLLNGERLLLRGTHRHEDHAGVGAAMTEEMIVSEMTLMKAMGVNFIRLGHYQQSRLVLDLCDSLGILVWEEIPWCRGGVGGEGYRQMALRLLQTMIEQHHNHPSIIIWGLGNENDWPGDFEGFTKEAVRAFMQELNDKAHELDASRKTAIRRCSFCSDVVDIYSPSIWAGWYRGSYREYKDVTEKEMRMVDRFLHVEWGGDHHAGRHSETPDRVLQAISTGKGADERAGDASLYGGSARVSRDGDWSETYICNLIDWHLKEQETMPWLTGAAYWPFKDFSTPVRPENPVPYVNQKGVVERDLTCKESYYVFQSFWARKLMAHLYGHSWPVRWGEAGEVKMVKVYSNCSEAELFCNGQSQGVRLRDSQDFPAAGLRWPVVFREGENYLKVVARRGSETVVDEVRFCYQTQVWGEPAALKLESMVSDAETVTVQALLVDGHGVPCLDAGNWVSFSVAGEGTLIDNLGTAKGARKVQLGNGRARIAIRKTGPCCAGVTSPGVKPALLTI